MRVVALPLSRALLSANGPSIEKLSSSHPPPSCVYMHELELNNIKMKWDVACQWRWKSRECEEKQIIIQPAAKWAAAADYLTRSSSQHCAILRILNEFHRNWNRFLPRPGLRCAYVTLLTFFFHNQIIRVRIQCLSERGSRESFIPLQMLLSITFPLKTQDFFANFTDFHDFSALKHCTNVSWSLLVITCTILCDLIDLIHSFHHLNNLMSSAMLKKLKNTRSWIG